jgi:hypothetical protein
MTAILIAAQIAMTGMQIAAIQATEFAGALGGIIPQFAKGGMVHGKSHSQGGEKFRVGGRVVELEGGEAVINKRSTAMFRGQLSAMNEAGGGKKFAQGGLMGSTLLQNQIRKDSLMHTRISDEDWLAITDLINVQKVAVHEAHISTTQRTVNVQESRARF